LPLTMDSKRC